MGTGNTLHGWMQARNGRLLSGNETHTAHAFFSRQVIQPDLLHGASLVKELPLALQRKHDVRIQHFPGMRKSVVLLDSPSFQKAKERLCALVA